MSCWASSGSIFHQPTRSAARRLPPSRSTPPSTMSARRAAASAMPSVNHALPHRRLRLGTRYVDINDGSGAVSRRPDKISSAGPPAPASNSRSAATGAPSSNTTSRPDAAAVRPQRLWAPGVAIDPRIHFVKFGLNYRSATRRGADGRAPETMLPESDVWNVHAQTMFLPQGLSVISFALCRAQQPDGGAQTAADLDHDRIPRHEAVAAAARSISTPNWRRALVSPARSDLVGSRTARRKRPALPFRRCARTLVLQADLRSRRRAGRRRRRPNQLPAKRDIDRVTFIIGRSRSATSSTTTPMRTIRAPIS